MKQKNMETQKTIRELIDCQQRINELETLGAKEEDALLEAQTVFEDLFEASPEALVLVGRLGHIIRMNEQAEKLFGYTRRELIGTDHGVLVPDRFRAKHDADMKNYMAQPRVRIMGIGLDLSGRRKDGTEFPADIDLGPLDIKKEFFVLAVVRDATKRKALEDELNNYKQRLEQTVAERIVEFSRTNEKLMQEVEGHRRSEEGLVLKTSILGNAREAIFLINPKGDFAYVNEAALQTYGYSREEFLGMNLNNLLRPEETPLIAGQLKEVKRTGQMELETIHLRKDQSAMPVQVRYSLIKTTHGQFIVSVMRDMTDEFRLRLLLEIMPGILWATDNRLIVTMSKGMALEAAGLKRDEGAGIPFPAYLERNGFGTEAIAAHQQALSGTSSSFATEHKKSGRTFYGWAAPLTEVQGTITGAISVAVDATEYIGHK